MDVSKKKLLRFPFFVIIHIALVAAIFNIVYPEVKISSLPMVIGGAGFCLAFCTDYLYTKLMIKKDKQKNTDGGINEGKNK